MARTAAARDFLDSAVVGRLARLTALSRIPMLGSVSGIHRSATRGSSVEFAEYRKYVPGDDIRHVDWRVYARSDRFYMKDFEADTNLRCHLVLDTSGSMGFVGAQGARLDYARRLAATLAYLFIHQGDAVGLACANGGGSREVPPRRTPSHLQVLFDRLGEVRAGGDTRLADTLHRLAEQIKSRALVLVFSDCFAELPALLDSFEHMRFRKHDLAVFHLLDRQEAAFAFDRPIRFVDLEEGGATITDPPLVRAAYLQEFERHQERLKRGSQEFSVDYRRVFTDMDYEGVLAEFLLERMRRKAGAGR